MVIISKNILPDESLKELVDRTERSLEYRICDMLHNWEADCEAERKLETQIIKFPKR